MSDVAAGSVAAVAPSPLGTVQRLRWLACVALIASAAFILYCVSGVMLERHSATMHFGADTSGYSEFARGDVLGRMKSTYDLDRILRFHLTTATLAVTWMTVLAPLTRWVAPLYLLKTLFAGIGAVGVGAATCAFAAVMARRYAMIFGVIYAVSFSVWYFSSLQESKIVSATLATLYIGGYLRLRENWTARGAILQAIILLLACMNELVAGFLVIIPVIDTLVRHGPDWRQGRWIAAHALVGPLAYATLEGFSRVFLAADVHPEGASHLSMLVYYVSRGYHSLGMFYNFAVNWLFFGVAAPASKASLWDPPGFFEPTLLNYFASPVRAPLAVLFIATIVASVLRFRGTALVKPAGIVLGLTAYTLVRGVFFFIFDPPEPILFSASITLAYLLLIGILITGAELPAKPALLATFAALLFLANQSFIIGW